MRKLKFKERFVRSVRNKIFKKKKKKEKDKKIKNKKKRIKRKSQLVFRERK